MKVDVARKKCTYLDLVLGTCAIWVSRDLYQSQTCPWK